MPYRGCFLQVVRHMCTHPSLRFLIRKLLAYIVCYSHNIGSSGIQTMRLREFDTQLCDRLAVKIAVFIHPLLHHAFQIQRMCSHKCTDSFRYLIQLMPLSNLAAGYRNQRHDDPPKTNRQLLRIPLS